MGFEPGKQSKVGVPAGPRPDVSGPSGIPGKATLAGALPTSAAAIGDRYIENREHCAPGVDGCFLTDTQRTRLVTAYQGAVQAAQMQYAAALTQIRFDRLIKKAEELPFFLSLALDVIAAHALVGLGLAVKALKSAGASQIASDELGWMMQLQDGSGGGPSSITTLVGGISEPAVGFVIKAAVDEAKKQIKKTSPPDTEKGATLNYIGELEDASAVAFERQRLDPPGYATDADLIVLFHSFKAAMGHTTPRYKAALEDKIDRYLASSTSRIGRHAAKTQRDFDVQGNTARDTKVVWVRSSGTPVPTLYYYKRDFQNSQNEHTMGDVEIEPLQPLDNRFKIDRPVETEFVDVAIAKHRAAWGTEPETKEIDPAILPRWRPTRDAGDLNQYVPANNPDFQRAEPPPRDVGDLDQYVPANNPDFQPVGGGGSAAQADPVVARGPRHVK